MQSSLLKNVILSGRKFFEPQTYKPVSELMAELRYVSPQESVRSGPWDNTNTPLAVEVMDSFCDPKIERITFMGCSQFVKTEIIKNIIAYIIYYELGPILIVYPTDGDAREFSKEKLEPMLINNKFLRDKVAPFKSNSKENSTLFKKFGVHFLAIVGGRVPQDLARRSVKYVIVDDRARVVTAGSEGDSVALAWQRTESYAFFGRKLLEFSSPTIADHCPIEKSYKMSDMRRPYVPCPHCGEYQIIKFENMEWEKEEIKIDLFNVRTKHKPETVKLKCTKCNTLIDERHKNWMVQRVKWIADKPDIIEHRGYGDVGRYYSLFSGWKDIVREFLSSKDDKLLLQVVYNTIFGQTFKLEENGEIDNYGLMKSLDNYLTEDNPGLPNEILLLTCAVDTHPDRLELSVEGWGMDEENWLVHYEQLWGDVDQLDVRAELDKFLETKWIRQDGVELTLGGALMNRRNYATLIDSGGRNTQSVYEYCRQRQHMGIIAIKGRAGAGYPALLNRSAVGPNRDVILQNLGVDTIKEIIWRRLARSIKKNEHHEIKGAKVCHFTSKFCDLDYFKGLLSERPFINYDRSLGKVIIWKKLKLGIRNEPWDLKVYNYAAMKIVNPNFEALRENLLKENPERVEIEQKKISKNMKPLSSRGIKSNWIKNWG